MPMNEAALPPPYRAYILGLLLGALVWVVPAGVQHAFQRPLDTILWITFLAAGNLLAIPMLPRWRLNASLGTPVHVAAAVVFPAPMAVLLGLLGLTAEPELRRQTSLWASAFNRSQVGLATGAASLASRALPWEGTLKLVAGTAVAAVVFNLVNAAAVTTGLWLRRNLGFAAAARVSAAPFPHFAADYAFVSLLALLIVLAYVEVGRWAIVLLAIPLWLGFNALRSAREAEDRAEQLAETVRELETFNALGSELLTVRSLEQVAATGRGALLTALATNDISLSLSGDIGEGIRVVKIPGAEPAALGIPVDSSEDALRVAEGIAGLLGMALQRLKLESELADVQEARMALTGQILEEGTRERSRIALEIHDEVLPYFAAAEIQADNVSSALGAARPDRAIEIAGRTRDAVHDGIKQLREVLEALRRQVVVPGGLREGLSAALDELRVEHGVHGVLEAPDPLPPLPLALEILILETVRGCLTNIARHAQADQVQVRLEVAETVIAVEICDNGRGFDPAAVPSGHHGLALMAQRVSLARGRFKVDSASGQGTKVLVEVPA